jgi:coenzyme F420-reducing hydrogenase alpha subunit
MYLICSVLGGGKLVRLTREEMTKLEGKLKDKKEMAKMGHEVMKLIINQIKANPRAKSVTIRYGKTAEGRVPSGFMFDSYIVAYGQKTSRRLEEE